MSLDVTVQKQPFYLKPVEAVLDTLKASKEGLSTAEAQKRLETFGPNKLKEKEKEPWWKRFFAQFTDFLVLILIGAAVFSTFETIYINVTKPAEAEFPTDAIVIVSILMINAILGFYQENQAEAAIEALKKMSAARARVLRDGEIKEIPAEELVPGDLIVLETGDQTPADGRVIDALELKTDEASLTGESLSVKKTTGPIDKECGVGDRINLVYSSTIITYGRGRAVVYATGMNTEIGKIATSISETEDEQTPLAKKIDAFGKKLGYLILAVCAISFVMYLIQNFVNFDRLGFTDPVEPVLDAVLVAVALAVAAIPEGLPAIVTTSLALGVQRMAKRNAIVRKLPSVETLGCTTVICSDKTGTLTKNEMTIRRVFVDGNFIEVGGSGYEPSGEFVQGGDRIDASIDQDLNLLAKVGVFCNNSTLRYDGDAKKWVITGDPTEAAFLTLGGKLKITPDGLAKEFRRVSEVFFSSERKKMSTVDMNVQEETFFVSMKGGFEPMLPNLTHVLVNGEVRKLTQADIDAFLKAQDEMSSNALRVLACAYKAWKKEEVSLEPDTVEKDLILIGLVGMIDPPRPEAKVAVAKCKNAGIGVVMITGDHAATAKAIALELGILEQETGEKHEGRHRIIQGLEIDKLSDGELTECSVFARVSPEHKMRIVKALQDAKNIVSMTGDGVNDAPALKKSNAGVAMGITGTDVAKGAADIILADDNFASIVAAVEEGRGIYDNMKRFINFLISCNLGEILVVFLAAVFGLPAPLQAIHLLWVNLLTDGVPALAMGFEKADADVMLKPPRPVDEPIITKRNWLSYISSGAVIGFACLITFYYGLQHTHQVEFELIGTSPATFDLVFTTESNYFEAFYESDHLTGKLTSDMTAFLNTNGITDTSVVEAAIKGALSRAIDNKDGPLLEYPRTLAFSSLIVAEMMNAYNCRSESISIFKKKISDNYFLLLAVAISMVCNLFVIYFPPAYAVFRIQPLDWMDWVIVLIIASPRIWSEEIIKIYWRRAHPVTYLKQEAIIE
ncbi:MAG: cation-translocating P-type ATPase [Candidatus Lokiarchaeota archaeon]|nr:cation-translocating P-type ATPase [Candidatus Lokiarchaeota archaeon]